MMRLKEMRLPITIFVIGIIAAVAAYMLTGIVRKPTITEHDFEYTVTYRVNGEEKSFTGVYACSYSDSGLESVDRYYSGEYKTPDSAKHYGAYTIAQKDGLDLCIVTGFNDSYLMGDTANEYYDDQSEDPYLLIYDAEEYTYEDADAIAAFDAEIISWEYPEPIKNTFVFVGFASLYEGSMFAMLFVGLLVLIACLIFVKKDVGAAYGVFGKFGVVLSVAVGVVVLPFITLLSWIVQAFATGPDWIYQGYLCLPVLILFSLGAAISLRRKGFEKSGFFVQLIGPVLFMLLIVLETFL